MTRPTTLLHPIRALCPHLRPITALAVVSLLLGCSTGTRYAPAVLGPKPAEQVRQFEPSPGETSEQAEPRPIVPTWRQARPKTAVHCRPGRTISLPGRWPAPVEDVAATPVGTAKSAEARPAATTAAPAPQPVSNAAGALIPAAPPELAMPAAAAAATALPPGTQFDGNKSSHRLARCRARMARSEWYDAIDDCRKAAELAPKSAEPWAELMRIYVTIGSYGEAAEAARAVLARNPGDAVAYYYLGWALSGHRQYPDSLEAFEKAVSIDPARVEYRQGLGITYCLADNFANGIAVLEAAQELAPNDAKTNDLLGQTRSLLAEHLSAARKQVKRKPRDPASHAKLASKLQRYGFTEEALAEYDLTLTRLPSSLVGRDAGTTRLAAVAHYNRGVLSYELGRDDVATVEFAKVLEIDPSLAAETWYYVGLIAYDKGDNEEAIRALNNSVEAAPRVIENRTALALAYEKSGETAAAKKQRSAIAQLEP